MSSRTSNNDPTEAFSGIAIAPMFLYSADETPGARRTVRARKDQPMAKIRTSPHSHTELERIVRQVADSYRGGRGIDSLESAALPNQRKVVEAVEHLKHVIYMGFYATRDL